MDGFNIIQHFFTRMRCQFCTSQLEKDGVELIRQEQSVYIVNVHCMQCARQMGIALVGLQHSTPHALHQGFLDPELTPEEIDRLARFQPIDYNDVVDAHRFFSALDENWQQYLPEEMRQLEITLEPESDKVKAAH